MLYGYIQKKTVQVPGKFPAGAGGRQGGMQLVEQTAGFEPEKRLVHRGRTLRGCQGILKPAPVGLGESEYLSILVSKSVLN